MTCVALIIAVTLLSWAATRAADAPTAIGFELNRPEDQGGNCRAHLVISNPRSDDFSSFTLDLVLFDHGGMIMRRPAVDLASLQPAKTSVKIFEISESACGAIGAFSSTTSSTAAGRSGEVAGCIDRVTTSSKLAVSLSK